MIYSTIFKLGILATLFAVASCQQDALVAEIPQHAGGSVSMKVKFALVGDANNNTHKWSGEDLKFELRQGKNADENVTATFDTEEVSLNAMVNKFAELRGTTAYKLLSSEHYELPTSVQLKKGVGSVSFSIKIKDVEEGVFVLPLILKSGEEELGIQFVEVVKAPEVDINMNWLDRIPTVSEPRFVAVVEASENDLRNVGNYMLYPEGDASEEKKMLKRPLFDMTVIFSANVNFDEGSQEPVLHYNKEVKRILDNRDIFVKPLQDKGIKVLISLMPNRQGIGFSNLDVTGERRTIKKLARDVADMVKQYGLDGMMFDDEYAGYPQSMDAVQPGRPTVQMGSFHFLIKELRELMPIVEGQQWKDRHNLITLYNIGPFCAAAAGGHVENWGLFGNHFNLIKAGEGSGWADNQLKAVPAKKEFRTWVQDPVNQPLLDEVAQIKAGEIFDFIWSANYLRGDDHRDAPMGSPDPDDTQVGWFAGMDTQVASEKYGLASFEMSLELVSTSIKHQDKFWMQANYPDPGRQESIARTLQKQQAAQEKTILTFNLQYVPDKWNGREMENPYSSNDFGYFMRTLGNKKDPIVKFEGTSYDTVIPSYLKQ